MVLSNVTSHVGSTAQPTALWLSGAQSQDRPTLKNSSFQPVTQVAKGAKQQLHFKQGAIDSPLTNALSAAGYSRNPTASLVTYGADGKLRGPHAATQLFVQNNFDVSKESSPNTPKEEGGTNAIRLTSTPNEGTFDEKQSTQETEVQKEQRYQDQKQAQVRELASRDREVRSHEQAHAAIGGVFAGAPSYHFERGPDGVSYAVGGEVPIDTSSAATPELTIAKAQTVKRAALAPAEPSPQDRRVAQEAVQLEAEARRELTLERAKDADNKPQLPANTGGDGDKNVAQAPGNVSTENAKPAGLNAEPANALPQTRLVQQHLAAIYGAGHLAP